MVKNVLIVSYYIGNNFGVGGRRWLKYANQLAVNNYEVHLLSTAGNIDYSQLNHKIHIHEIKSNYPHILNKVDFNLIDKIQCKIFRLTSIGNPPYHTTFEHRDNYKVIYP